MIARPPSVGYPDPNRASGLVPTRRTKHIMALRHAFATLAGATLLVAVPATVAAAAEDYPGGTTPSSVLSESQDRPDEVLGTSTARVDPLAATQQTLPVTGGDLVGLAVVGVSLIGVGTVVVRRSRRSTTAAA